MPTTRSRRGTKPRARRRYWSHKVKTVSTYPPKGLFSKDAKTIAGHNLSRSRREELLKAKWILRRMSEARGR